MIKSGHTDYCIYLVLVIQNRTYGITAIFTDTNGKCSKKAVNDISSVKENVEKIMNILTENKVSFYHFEDLIEDILFDEALI